VGVVKLSKALVHKRRQDNQMRNLIFAINITLDGCCDHTKTIGSDETLEYYTAPMHSI
jgi:hypothetical protein